MLTKSARTRLSIVFILCSFFCVIPAHWNSKSKTFGPVKYRFRYYFNRLLIVGSPAFMAYINSCILYDFLQGEIPMFDLLINMFYGIGGSLLFCAGIMLNYDFKNLAPIICNVLRLDQEFQDTLLTKREIQFYEKQYSLIVMTSNIFEPVSIINSMFVGLHFYEEYDLCNRYFYRPLKFLFGFDSPYYDIPFIIIYIGFVRVACGFLLIAAMIGSLYAEFITFWLKQIQENPRILQKSFDPFVLKLYRTLQVFHIHINDTISCQVGTVAFLCGGFFAMIIGNCCTIQIFGSGNLGANLAAPCFMLLIFFFALVFFIEAGKAEINSTSFVEVWGQEKGWRRKIRMILKTCRPIRYTLRNYFVVNRGSFVEFMQGVVEKTADVLLM